MICSVIFLLPVGISRPFLNIFIIRTRVHDGDPSSLRCQSVVRAWLFLFCFTLQDPAASTILLSRTQSNTTYCILNPLLVDAASRFSYNTIQWE